MSGETWKVPHTFIFVSLFRYVLKFERTDVSGFFGGENPGLEGRRAVWEFRPYHLLALQGGFQARL